MSRIAVVTGSNKGIGYAIVRGLCQKLDGLVYLTSRNVDLGKKAMADLKTELGSEFGAKLRYHQLDICDRSSVESLRDHMQKEHGGVDIVVNNAATVYKDDTTAPLSEQAEGTLQTNYFGTRTVCDVLFPILKPHARVVFLCSRLGLLTSCYSDAVKAQLYAPSLTIDQLDTIARDFIATSYRSSKEGVEIHQQNGYPNSSYGMSKALGIAMSLIYHRRFCADARPDIIVNSCCPGSVSTDAARHSMARHCVTIDEGAQTPLWLALLPVDDQNAPRGKFCYDLQAHSWQPTAVYYRSPPLF